MRNFFIAMCAILLISTAAQAEDWKGAGWYYLYATPFGLAIVSGPFASQAECQPHIISTTDEDEGCNYLSEDPYPSDSPSNPPASPSKQSFVDTPPGRQEIWQSTSVHVCPPGYAMAGAHVIDNQFTCLRVVADGGESQVHSFVDTGTQKDFGRGDMHECPQGTYMRGLHANNNWLICSDGATLDTAFLDAAGATQGNGMHMCPAIGGQQTVMTGIHDARNDFACAKP